MDFLSQHRALVDCFSKEVIVRSLENDAITFCGEKSGKPIKLISALKASELLKRGCEGFLAYVHDTEQKEANIEDLVVVREFVDVFPNELPGVIPDREVEFTIDLVPGTQPISIAHYRMAPTELL